MSEFSIQPPTNRAERRRHERKAAQYDKRTHFTKAEVETMNTASYQLGIQHTLEAANIKLGIGPARQEKIREGLKLLQALDFDYSMRNLK